ncbi:MAG TPA: hypothetical protein VE343_16085, partial [Streptosporangiaceae bacterium]|nr:hypothetical protein [Streptosporangiaceae bacterium]
MSMRTKFFALTYDRQMAKTEKAGLRAFRERLLAGLSGDVLEIGGGTGLRRVLRPGGQLLFIEHVRADDAGTAQLQDRMNWLFRLVVCCDCNRPTLDSIKAAGFTLARLEHTALPNAPKFV